MTLQGQVPKRPCPFQEGCIPGGAVSLFPGQEGYSPHRTWTAPSYHAWAIGSPEVSLQLPVARALASPPDRSPASDWTTKSKDFRFQRRKRRPLESRVVPARTSLPPMRSATTTDARAGDLSGISANAPLTFLGPETKTQRWKGPIDTS